MPPADRNNDFVALVLTHKIAMQIVPATSRRGWMDDSQRGFANRCLPMRIANQLGWFILNDRAVRARWTGSREPDGVEIEQSLDSPPSAISHFGEGILTFTLPFLFRTPPGVSLLLRGPANLPKDAVLPLEGLVETDWAVASTTMNWKFTRPDTWVEFIRDEPIGMIVPHRVAALEDIVPRMADLLTDTETMAAHEAWRDSCLAFTKRLQERDPEAVRRGWQRYYFLGESPGGASASSRGAAHRTALALKDFR